MTHTAERGFPGLPIILLTAFLLLLYSQAQMASAVVGNDHAVIHLTGKHADGKYTLNTKDLYLFSLENIAPVDQWNGSVIVQDSEMIECYSGEASLPQADPSIDIDSAVSDIRTEILHAPDMSAPDEVSAEPSTDVAMPPSDADAGISSEMESADVESSGLKGEQTQPSDLQDK